MSQLTPNDARPARHYRLNEWHDTKTLMSAGFSVQSKTEDGEWRHRTWQGQKKRWRTRQAAEFARLATIAADRAAYAEEMP